MSRELLIGVQFADTVVPLGMKIDSSMRASDFTEAVRAHLDALQSLAEYPISLRSDIDFTPSVALVLCETPGPAREGDGVAISVALSEGGTVVRYDPSRYSGEFIDAFFASMKRLYNEMVSDRPLRDIPLVQGKADGFRVELRTEGTVNAVFASAVARAPEKEIVIAADRAMTYREIDTASNRIGNALIRRGVKPHDRVLLLMRRRSDLLFCLFGVVKAGAVFITMDPEYPKARIDQIVEDSGAVYILSDIPENKAKYDNCISPSELMGDDGAGQLYDLEHGGQARGRARLLHRTQLHGQRVLQRRLRLSSRNS